MCDALAATPRVKRAGVGTGPGEGSAFYGRITRQRAIHREFLRRRGQCRPRTGEAMRQRSMRDFDLKVRLSGVGFLLLAALCLSALSADRGSPDAQPSGFDLCMALIAVCSGCVGAALALEGRWLFEPVSDPRARRNVHGDDARDKE